MSTFPVAIVGFLAAFAPLFSRRVWQPARILLAGAIRTPARRTVAATRRVTGLADPRRFHRYHRVLSHARWSGRAVGRVLLCPLVRTVAPTGPLGVGIDETIERRRGERSAAKGISRDPVRASHAPFVKASGLRWVGALLPVRVPRAGRAWASPVLTALAPSERHDRERGRRHKAVAATRA